MLQSTMAIVVNVLNHLAKLSPGCRVISYLAPLSLSADIYVKNVVCSGAATRNVL